MLTERKEEGDVYAPPTSVVMPFCDMVLFEGETLTLIIFFLYSLFENHMGAGNNRGVTKLRPHTFCPSLCRCELLET